MVRPNEKASLICGLSAEQIYAFSSMLTMKTPQYVLAAKDVTDRRVKEALTECLLADVANELDMPIYVAKSCINLIVQAAQRGYLETIDSVEFFSNGRMLVQYRQPHARQTQR